MINAARILVTVGFSLVMGMAFASGATPKEGVDYLALKNPQPAASGDRVEVLEFFGYFCNHCFSLDIALDDWARRQQKSADFRRVHVRFGAGMIAQQRLFYAVSTAGQASASLHHKAFESIHVKRQPLRTEAQVEAFIKQNVFSPEKFIETLNSAQVRTLSDEALRLQALYQIDAVPVIVIDGRFLTSLAVVSQGDPSIRTAKEAQTRMLSVMDGLVAQILTDRREKQQNQTSKNR